MDWKNIWANRDYAKSGAKLTLRELIEADGFDQGMGSFSDDQWIDRVISIAEKLEISEGDTIFEVGCGAGAFLAPMVRRYAVNPCGIDLSGSLVKLAKEYMPGGRFFIGDVLSSYDVISGDVIISHSVFQYFPRSLGIQIANMMLSKASKTVWIGDIPDASKQKEAEKYRAEIFDATQAKSKYEGLVHSYYDPQDFLNQSSISKNWDIVIEKESWEGYHQSNYRFSVLFKRRKRNDKPK